MPRLSVWFVRASLLYLLLGFAVGALTLAEKGISYYPPVWHLFPSHEFLLVGWLIQLATGVAFWILLRFSTGQPRGNQRPIWVAFALINTGILLIVLQLWVPLAVLIGRILEVAGIVIYIIGAWRRVKPIGMQQNTVML